MLRDNASGDCNTLVNNQYYHKAALAGWLIGYLGVCGSYADTIRTSITHLSVAVRKLA